MEHFEKRGFWVAWGSVCKLLSEKMLEVGVEPTPAINGGDFKSPVSTIPPSEQGVDSYQGDKSLLREGNTIKIGSGSSRLDW